MRISCDEPPARPSDAASLYIWAPKAGKPVVGLLFSPLSAVAGRKQPGPRRAAPFSPSRSLLPPPPSSPWPPTVGYGGRQERATTSAARRRAGRRPADVFTRPPRSSASDVTPIENARSLFGARVCVTPLWCAIERVGRERSRTCALCCACALTVDAALLPRRRPWRQRGPSFARAPHRAKRARCVRRAGCVVACRRLCVLFQDRLYALTAAARLWSYLWTLRPLLTRCSLTCGARLCRAEELGSGAL